MSTGPPLRSDRDQWSPVWIGNSNRLPEPSRCAESTLCRWAKVARSRTQGSEGLPEECEIPIERSTVLRLNLDLVRHRSGYVVHLPLAREHPADLSAR
jgi:hypothetical protein